MIHTYQYHQYNYFFVIEKWSSWTISGDMRRKPHWRNHCHSNRENHEAERVNRVKSWSTHIYWYMNNFVLYVYDIWESLCRRKNHRCSFYENKGCQINGKGTKFIMCSIGCHLWPRSAEPSMPRPSDRPISTCSTTSGSWLRKVGAPYDFSAVFTKVVQLDRYLNLGSESRTVASRGRTNFSMRMRRFLWM